MVEIKHVYTKKVIAKGDTLQSLINEVSSLQYGDFSNMDCGGISFKCKNLSYANFSYSILLDTNFSFANLTGINIIGSLPEGTNFFGANLKDIKFYWSSFSNLMLGEILRGKTDGDVGKRLVEGLISTSCESLVYAIYDLEYWQEEQGIELPIEWALKELAKYARDGDGHHPFLDKYGGIPHTKKKWSNLTNGREEIR